MNYFGPQDSINHIGRHNVSPDEVEEVCFGHPFVRRAKSHGENPVYYVSWPNERRSLSVFCVVIQFPDGNGYPVTRRGPMTNKERQRYRQWRDR